MSKKYLSIEEAAAEIGISTAELNRLREKGTIRAFADRGTWKFKEEDVEKLARSRQTDSDPDVPLQNFETGKDDSGADLVFSDEDMLGSQPTIIRKGSEDSGSDSDVRLIFDDSMSVPEAKAAPEDSDSDVKLAGGTAAGKEPGSDSDVKLIGDNELTEASGSDSDVRLVSSDSSGDVKIAGSKSDDSAAYPGPDDDDSTIGLASEKKKGSSVISEAPEGSSVISEGPGGSSVISEGGEGSSVIEQDSGISLAEGSGLALASDSGISLEQPNDSGISLAEEGSVVLSDESGISLAADSGISLAPDSSKVKGKAPAKPKGKGKGKPADSDDLTGTIPLMDVPSESEDILDTQMEVPMMGDSSDESSDDSVDGSNMSGTSVITLDDEGSDDYAVTGKEVDATDEEMFPVDEEVVDVADEVVGEDDELAEDVIGAEDEDFGEVESGSSAELPIGPSRMAAPVEQEWGTMVFSLLTISAVLMIACGTLMFDMVRNMWHTDSAKQNPVASFLLDQFKS